MSFELSNDDKKSLGITTVVYALLILLLFLLRFWPPADMKIMGGGGGGGIEMNFGDSDFGMGDNYKSEVLNVKDQAKVTPTATTPDEDVISDDNSDDNNVVIPKKENIKKTPVDIKKDIVKPVVAPKPTVSKNANDALSSILGNKGGDGNDGKSGNKGSANGNLNSSGYYGNGSGTGTGGGNGSGNGTGSGSGNGSGSGSGSGGGNGSGSGYSLGNRKALSKPQPDYTCQEQGRVAVEVKVDRNGKTIEARAGVQGTTNTAKCLLDQAKIAALETRWQADSNAQEIQTGKIIYTFSLN